MVGDPGLPVMVGLLAVPVGVLLFVLTLTLMGSRWTAPALAGAPEYAGDLDGYEDDLLLSLPPYDHGPAYGNPGPAAALVPAPRQPYPYPPQNPQPQPQRAYGSLARQPWPAHDEHGAHDPYDPYGSRGSYGSGQQGRDPYGTPIGEPERSAGFPYGPYKPG